MSVISSQNIWTTFQGYLFGLCNLFFLFPVGWFKFCFSFSLISTSCLLLLMSSTVQKCILYFLWLPQIRCPPTLNDFPLDVIRTTSSSKVVSFTHQIFIPSPELKIYYYNSESDIRQSPWNNPFPFAAGASIIHVFSAFALSRLISPRLHDTWWGTVSAAVVSSYHAD